jgi:superfamily II DNA or RNA helicase/diadenosine tetraphosphate (Ap4A) HIT family hydrolase
VSSVFLDVPPSAWVASNAHAFAFRDKYPVSPGHTLVVTRRVVADWFGATDDERRAVFALVDEVKRQLDDELRPDGYNVGFNAGTAAGQTVMHLHVHIIPRFYGDMDDPRGGVRYAIPSKGNYLRDDASLTTGGEDDPLARQVLPLFDRASDIAIVAAFVQESGLARIASALDGALARGARVRLITGDYLEITQVGALETLLDWQLAARGDDGEAPAGSVETRVVEVATLPGRTRSFHPKSWRFESSTFGVAFVGSSNLSQAALVTGIEWNLRVDRDRDAAAYARICQAFEALWGRARVLDSAWIHEYARRARAAAHALPPGEVEPEPLEPAPAPHQVQREALAKLHEARDQGRRRALVVLATGLGKTWLAAYDYRQLRDEAGARPRLLFLAHRRELLRQAAATYRRLLRAIDPSARVGWFNDEASDLSADLVFASVAKLARPEHLQKLRAERFDYVVVDEVHHAAAESYRRILDALAPRFLLGLTATPERADAGDILGLFDDFVAYRADIPRGITLGRLTPFHYHGIKDSIDYEHIPWRNRRFDPEALAAAAQAEARMQTMWGAWQAHPSRRTLVFCCSIAHASYVRDWLRSREVAAAAVYAAEGSDDRDASLAAFERGELEALCAVDIFNEGVDVPSIDRVVMLRPTESNVVFLQQLGRGLRASAGKAAVTVIDFVGNHRVFLGRLRALLAMAGADAPATLRTFLTTSEPHDLPAGCSVELELEAKELLTRFFRTGGADEVERAYRELRAERGERPTAGELQRMGYLPSRLRERHGGWFDFVRAEGDLDDEEARVVEAAGGFLREVETTEMTKCFKMVTLEALIEADALLSGATLRDVARRSHELLRRSPELFADVAEKHQAAELDAAHENAWLAYWRRNPIDAWTAEKRDRRTWMRLENERLRLALNLAPSLEATLARLTRELVDYRLAQYRARRRQGVASVDGFVCKVTWNQRDPILKLPSRKGTTLPEGEVDIRLNDGSVWQFRFAKEFCNVARPAGAQNNRLPDLLRRWFGPRAGHPGTAFEVRFYASPDGLWVEPIQAPVQATAVDLPPRRGVAAYPDLRAAAGHALGAIEPPEQTRVWLPVENDAPDLFAVRVAGTSMDGGATPLRDGDWALMRLARGEPGSALAGRVVLVELSGEGPGAQYQIKRLRQQGNRWALTSDNPDGPTIEPHEAMTVIARLERSLPPEELAPAVGTLLDDADLPTRFGLEDLPPRSGRHGGHLFLFVDRKGLLTAPNQVRFASPPPRPGETAFVLAKRTEGDWRYLGVGRQDDSEGSWRIPDVDFATWHTWGEGREV